MGVKEEMRTCMSYNLLCDLNGCCAGEARTADRWRTADVRYAKASISQEPSGWGEPRRIEIRAHRPDGHIELRGLSLSRRTFFARLRHERNKLLD